MGMGELLTVSSFPLPKWICFCGIGAHAQLSNSDIYVKVNVSLYLKSTFIHFLLIYVLDLFTLYCFIPEQTNT